MARPLLSPGGMFALAMIVALHAMTPSPASVAAASAPASAPPIAEVQRRAIAYARLDPADISSWKKRARLSPLLPRLQVDYGMRLKNEVNVNVNESVYVGSSGVAVGPDQGGIASNQNSDQNVGVRAIWSLNEAIFNPELLAVSEETRLLARERQAILAEVNRNYYDRDRAKGEMSLLAEQLRKDPRHEGTRRELLLKRIALDEATAALDALTGGWFGGQLQEGR